MDEDVQAEGVTTEISVVSGSEAEGRGGPWRPLLFPKGPRFPLKWRTLTRLSSWGSAKHKKAWVEPSRSFKCQGGLSSLIAVQQSGQYPCPQKMGPEKASARGRLGEKTRLHGVVSSLVNLAIDPVENRNRQRH